MEHLEHTQISIQFTEIYFWTLSILHTTQHAYLCIYIWKAGRGENIEKEFSQSIYNLL